MLNLDYLKQQAREMAAEAARAHKEAEAAQKAIDDAETFKKVSALKTLQALGGAVQKLIKHGLLSNNHSQTYLNQYVKVYGRDKAINEYLRLATLLLSQENFGVETTTARYGNGGLLWKGQSYKSAEELHVAVQELIGEDPLESVQWIYSILDSVFSDDPGAIVSACSTGERFEGFANLYRREVEAAKQPPYIPNISDITVEDAMLISSFLGQL
ncbi:hypothetical protein COO91_02401 [Nostoc flagelliforme CCNUN1]|uniref:Uncharacterized protein n=1 Tax=Nostoc flagelliforme CCNUN1 TaxID=2038116 RepID=A0A2K8SM32_9NOSO|nr:hypothetical protein [Nostoc flagelliforme]AUB36489.1 hypothetical protein COO91_02401 [Nostoc flagelliforme CCNUN1]